MSDAVYYEPCEVDEELCLAEIRKGYGVRTIRGKDVDENDRRHLIGSKWELPREITPKIGIDGAIYDPEKPDWNPESWKDRIRIVSAHILRLMTDHMYFTDDRHAAAITNFILNTYFYDSFFYAPRLIIGGITQCGKSRLLDMIASMSYHGRIMPDTSPAAAFREMERHKITPILDELQDYDKDRRTRYIQIIKNGLTPKGMIILTEGKGVYEPKEFRIFAPLAVVNKSGGFLPEDVINRSISIGLITKPDNVILKTLLDREEMARIRTELYSIMAFMRQFPDQMQVGIVYEETLEELDSGKPINIGGRKEYIFHNRTKDLASTYYTLAKLSGTEEEILSLLNDQQDQSMTALIESIDGLIFRGVCDLVITNAPFGVGRDKNAYLGDALRKICTRDVMERSREIQDEEGNNTFRRWDIDTSGVTRTMKGLGFTIVRGRNNKSFMAGNGNDVQAFLGCASRFATGEQQATLRRVGVL